MYLYFELEVLHQILHPTRSPFCRLSHTDCGEATRGRRERDRSNRGRGESGEPRAGQAAECECEVAGMITELDSSARFFRSLSYSIKVHYDRIRHQKNPAITRATPVAGTRDWNHLFLSSL